MELLIFAFTLILIYRYWGRWTWNKRVRQPETLKKAQRKLKQKIQRVTKRWKEIERKYED